MEDNLYCHGVDSILCCCLTHEEAEAMLNDCHGGACGGHLSGISKAQKNSESELFLVVHL